MQIWRRGLCLFVTSLNLTMTYWFQVTAKDLTLDYLNTQ